MGYKVSVTLCTILCLASSCKIWNPNQIYRTGPGYDYQEIPWEEPKEYELVAGDILEVRVFTNDGFRLVDAGLAGGQAGFAQLQQINYLVDQQGKVRLPMVDTVAVEGLTVLEAARALEERFEAHLVAPFVQVNVLNRRAFVYRGDGDANVVVLTNENMTLLEVLASAGGIPTNGKAYKVKLMRDTDNGMAVSLIDLRDPKDINVSDIIIKANDIIVVDPTFETSFLQQLTPFFAFLTSAVAVYGLFRTLGSNGN